MKSRKVLNQQEINELRTLNEVHKHNSGKRPTQAYFNPTNFFHSIRKACIIIRLLRRGDLKGKVSRIFIQNNNGEILALTDEGAKKLARNKLTNSHIFY
ncbi:hypothetical protein [Vreelandella sp.]|uniref:hypothetical protein n=1 Tax=Vreelandella sp. TaxID=3137778 RepID=UPI003BABB8FB